METTKSDEKRDCCDRAPVADDEVEGRECSKSQTRCLRTASSVDTAQRTRGRALIVLNPKVGDEGGAVGSEQTEGHAPCDRRVGECHHDDPDPDVTSDVHRTQGKRPGVAGYHSSWSDHGREEDSGNGKGKEHDDVIRGLSAPSR